MDITVAEQIAQVFAPLGYALHDAMPQAISRANDMMAIGSMEPERYRTHYKHNVVGCTHSLLRTADIGPWQLDPNARKKQLHLSKDLWTVRLLSSTFDNQVPNAGRNRARRGFYSNPQVAGRSTDQALLEQHGFLVKWQIDSQSSEVELELIHTLSPWRYGYREHVDLRMPLVTDETDLSNLKFTPADDDDLDGLGLIDSKGQCQRGVVDGRSASS